MVDEAWGEAQLMNKIVASSDAALKD